MNTARKKQEEPRDEGHPPDLLELRRRAAEAGVTIHLPTPGAKWIDREPIDFGVSVSDIVVRNRGRDPGEPAPLPIVSCEECRTDVPPPPAYEPTAEHEYPPDLLELKRRATMHGVNIRLPKPGAVWIDREPIDFGVSVSDIVIRNRGKVP